MPYGWVSAGIGAISLINSMSNGSSAGSALTSGSSPPNVNTSGTQSTQLPSWYTAYLQGALGTGENLASQPYQQYTGQRLAGFNDTQQTAFNAINNQQGNWSPLLQSSVNAASGVQGTAGSAGNLANAYGMGAYGAASNPVQSWTQPGVSQSWMSPYMSDVTNAIAQQGNQNFYNTLMPQIESQFIGNGNANSSANAAALSLGASQEQANISALQAQALQQGYTGAQQAQQTYAGQQLQQQGLQANAGLGAASTALQGGQLGTTAGLGAASQLGTNAGQLQSLGYNDISQLLSAGATQQQLAQTGYNTAYQNFENQVQWPMQQMSWLNSLATGAQLPTSTSATGSAPLAGATYGPSPLAYGYAAYQGISSNPLGGGYNTTANAAGENANNATGVGLSDSSLTTINTPGIDSLSTPQLRRGGVVRMRRGGLYEESARRLRAVKRNSKTPSPLQMMRIHGPATAS